MSYGHAGKLAAIVAAAQAAGATKSAPLIDPALYRREDMRPVLAERDIGALYRVLKDEGVTQRTIAELTGMHQSEVSEILKGRQVRDVTVLERICEGLRIPRKLMGLSSGGSDAYGGGEVKVTGSPERVTDQMRRRTVILSAPVALWGKPLFGEVPELPAPNWLVGRLPSRLEMIHVEAVADLLDRLRAWARAWGGLAEVLGAVAVQSKRLLTVPGEDTIRARLGSVLAELHTEAGWTYFDSGADDTADYYYCQALDIARQFGNRYQIAHTLRHAGMLPLERGRFNDSLECFQLGQIAFMSLDGSSGKDDPRAVPMTACLDSLQARALARMDHPEQARSKLAAARDKWQAPDAFADADYRHADVALCLGQLDGAEQFAARSVRAWGQQDRRPAASARILFATIHVCAGEPRGTQLAHNAITAAAKLNSDRVRKRLLPLADELDARRSSDARELARMARQVAGS